MKKILHYFVILIITSITTTTGKNYSSNTDKANEIYFTLTKERQANGVSKIKIVSPLNEKENGISKDSFHIEQKTGKNNLENVNKSLGNKDSHFDSLKSSEKSPSKYKKNYEKNVDKPTSSKKVSDNIAEFGPIGDGQLRFKKEIGKYDTNNKFNPGEYRYQDPLTGSYGFGYKTQSQYREEIRTADGTVRGNFGWIDESGKWHHTIFIADKNGYRTNTPENIINSYHSSNIPAESLTSETQKQSTYLSYHDKNEGSLKRKVTRIEPNRSVPRKKYPEGPYLINLKEKVGIKSPVHTNDSTNTDENHNSTYLSYIKSEPNLDVNKPIKTSPQIAESWVSNVNRTNISIGIKPTKHETITVTNLQDNFFNKLPLKPQKDNVSPPLDKPFKMYSNYLTKWPNMSWPKPSDPDLNQILGNLQGLSGRSNSFIESEPNFQVDNPRTDESKIAKSIYDSPLNKNFDKNKEKKFIKRTRSETTNNRQTLLFPYGDPQRSGNFDPAFVDTFKTIGYNSPSSEIVPYKRNSMYLPSNNVFGKTYVLIIPMYFTFYPFNPLQNVNLANPSWFQNKFSPNKINPFVYPVQPPSYVNPLNMHDISPIPNLQNFISSQNEDDIESDEDNEDNKDYLLLSDEFLETNGSITNDPAFENIQDFFNDTNGTKGFQNITFEKPINIFENNASETEVGDDDDDDDVNEVSDDKDDDDKGSEEHSDSEQDDDDHLNPRLINTLLREETNTHKEITFRLGTPLIRENFPVLLNED